MLVTIAVSIKHYYLNIESIDCCILLRTVVCFVYYWVASLPGERPRYRDPK